MKGRRSVVHWLKSVAVIFFSLDIHLDCEFTAVCLKPLEIVPKISFHGITPYLLKGLSDIK